MPSPSKAELRRGFAFAFVISVAVAAGCMKNDKTGNDGAPCDTSTDCKSKSCSDGTCAGRACDKEEKDAGTCDPGWTCVGGDQSDLARALGESSGPECEPTCGVCPSTTHCPSFATTASGQSLDADAGILCARGPARTATIAGPDSVLAGSTVTYTVTFAPAQTFEVYEWYYGLPGETFDDVTTSSGSHDNVLVFQPKGSPLGESDAVIGVTGADVNTSYDSKLMTGEGSRTIHVTCTPPGGDCSAYGSCCSGGTHCDYSSSAGTCM